MAYRTGNYNTFNDLLNIIVNLAQAHGWVVDAQKNNELYLHNATANVYWSVYNTGSELHSYLNTGYDASRAYHAQPGSSKSISGNCLTPLATTVQVMSYDLFVTADYIHVVVQLPGQLFYHFGCGTLVKAFEFDGGGYCYNTYSSGTGKNANWNSYGMGASTGGDCAVVDAVGVSGQKLRSSGNNSNQSGVFYALGRVNMSESAWSYHPEQYLVRYSQSKYGNILIPAANAIYALDRVGFLRRLGIVPDRYECSMVGIYPRQILEIAGDKWMIIPSCYYSQDLDFGSGTHGVAYRIID